jgi:phosphoribosylamine--glycine ligase
MNVAVLGSGGREHAIAWELSKSRKCDHIFTIPGNGGTPNNVELAINDFEELSRFCRQNKVELIIVGPEMPLAEGIVDYFATSDIKVFGPDKKASLLESSKIWAKQFMHNHQVATAESWQPESRDDGLKIAQKLNGKCVIKYDGLAGGKGVFVCSGMSEVHKAYDELCQKFGNTFPHLIEERLIGRELSIIGFTDGAAIKLLQPSQDHKQLLEGDKGPNTGGMGAYCPVEFCDAKMLDRIEEDVIKPTMIGIKKEALNYKGVLYFGLMLTDNGPKVLEYNVRMGDPEAEVILPALKTDLLEIILACFDGSLEKQSIDFNDGYFVDVVLVSKGYPYKYEKGYEIDGLDKLDKDILVFHAGTKIKDDKLFTNGGRVLNIVASADDLDNAVEKVYRNCEKVGFEGKTYRKDIAQRGR